MLTAEQIAKSTRIPKHTVRYRLDVLRTENKVKGRKYGTVWLYPEGTAKKVKNFDKRS